MWNKINTDTATNIRQVYQNLGNQDLKNPQLNYLSIPILLNYNAGKIFTLQAGPQFGILLNKDNNLLENGSNAFKNGDFSLLGGVQLNLLKLRIYGRYVIGLSDISDVNNTDKWRNQGIQLGLGLAL